MKRQIERIVVKKDLVIAGAGMAGICAAIQSARLGLKVALINNRGSVGGNASCEIRVAIGGADGCREFNFYSRETGIIEEIRLENLYKNPLSNPYIWDAVLRDFIYKEKNIELFLNTAIDEVTMKNDNLIECISGSQSGSEKRFNFYSALFLDNTGDGTVGYLSGAKFRMGREGKKEFNERIAPDKPDSYVLPNTLTFYAIDKGKPVKFIRPDFAVDITRTSILKYRAIPESDFYKSKWYYEYGGDKKLPEDNEEITKHLLALNYGIWDYVKNSRKYKSDGYDLVYMANVPGKRESRRLMGDYVLSERDIIEQKEFEDAVGHGGWSIDLHAIYGMYSKEQINRHYLLKGIYQIPYRCGYSINIRNLFFAGRNMSTTHVAFGSTRVIATLCTLAQAEAVAAYLCKKYRCLPRVNEFIFDNPVETNKIKIIFETTNGSINAELYEIRVIS